MPSNFFKDWIYDHYRDILNIAILKTLGKVLPVKFDIKEWAAKKTTEPANQAAPLEKPPHKRPFYLNPKYTFEGFVVGSSNRFAHAATLAIAEAPAKAYNPLFIYGGVGLGKTHLMQAACHYISEMHGDLKLFYTTSESFTNELINGIQSRTTQKFREKYRSVDVLLIDDIHFIAGKEATQEEFFHTFNALHQADKQIVVTSDRPPKAIPQLELRLVSRFEWGMVADIGLPDFETRTAILQRKVNNKGYEISDEIIKFIAQNIQHNIREMEGALNRILAHIQLQHSEPDQKTMENILANIIKNPKRKRLSAKEIIGQVSAFYDLDQKDITGKCRKKEYVRPRQIAMYLLRNELKTSFPFIGKKFGGKDHTTAIYACEKIKKELKEDSKLSNELELIKERIYCF